MHGHAHHGEHAHTHGVIDPVLVSTARGIRAIQWSFAALALTAALQLVVVWLSGSVALLADAIHNVGDAATAVPLWIAFLFARRRPSARFTYGLGRVEDLAGVVIVGVILSSALVAGWQALERLQNPQPIAALGAVAAAGVIGFLGNEAVAILRIRVGRAIGSVALIADGHHARSDGLTSLAVVAGAAGVWLGYPQADPIAGLGITLLILGIVWQSGRAVFTRLLDGVDPQIVGEIEHAARHLDEIRSITGIRARWLGHRLVADVDLVLDGNLPIEHGDQIADRFREEVAKHLPALGTLRVAFASRAIPVERGRMNEMPHTPHADHAPGTTGHTIRWAFLYDKLVSLLTLGRERALRAEALDLAGIAPGQTVLDAGCGTGTFAIAAKARVGTTGAVHGIDASAEMIARARRKADRAGVEVSFETAALEALPFPDAHFDVATTSLVLHHLPADLRLRCLRELRRVLRPGGCLLAVDLGGAGARGAKLTPIALLHASSPFDLDATLPELRAAGFHALETGASSFRGLAYVRAR